MSITIVITSITSSTFATPPHACSSFLMSKPHAATKKTAIVVGAGVACTALAARLADAGFQVTIVEKKTTSPAVAASSFTLLMASDSTEDQACCFCQNSSLKFSQTYTADKNEAASQILH